MNDIERVLLMILLLGAFAVVGFRRGFRAELVKFGFIVLGFLVSQKEYLGGVIIQIVNTTWFLFQIAINGGISALFSGGFDLDKLEPAVAAASENSPLIAADQGQGFLFLLMVLCFVLAFVVSGRVKKKSSQLLGLFMGVANGLLFAYIFRPYLSGTPILPPMTAETPLGGILQIFKTTFAVLLTPFIWLYEAIGEWIVPLFIIFVLLIALRNLRPAKPSK